MKGRLEGFLPAAALMMAITWVGLGFVVVSSGAAHGQNPPPGGGPGFPEEAFEACEGLAVEAACPITLPDGKTLTGVCTATPDEKIACVPEGDQPPPPPRN